MEIQATQTGEYPALIDTNPAQQMEQRRHSAREHVRLAIEDICEYASLLGENREMWQKQVAQLEGLHNQLGGQESKRSALTVDRLREIGSTVRQKRTALGLSVEKLAKRAGLSANTIKRVERGEQDLSRATLRQIAAISELGLDLSDVLSESEPTNETGGALNCYIAPGFDPVKMVNELGKLLNGSGGYVEQTNVYLDHRSASAWLAVSSEPGYVAKYRAPIPIDQAARRIVALTGSAGVDIVALGCGDAKEEVRLTQQLVGAIKRPDLRLYLLDISQPLLAEGFRHAEASLSNTYGVSYFAMLGNFHHLPRYPQIRYSPARAHRRRVVCLLGKTMANLEDELRFFRHSLGGFAENDFLLIDMQMGYASASEPAEIRRRDPALGNPLPVGHAEWLSSPIFTYSKGVAGVDFAMELNPRCPIPGSYEIEAVAHVRSFDKQVRRFSMHRWRRYDPPQVAECLSTLGWELVGDFRYGEVRAPGAVLLFRKRA